MDDTKFIILAASCTSRSSKDIVVTTRAKPLSMSTIATASIYILGVCSS